MKLFQFGLLVTVATTPLHATLVIEETFSYDPGNVAGTGGGLGFANPWASFQRNPTVAETGLTWGNLTVSGGTSRGGSWSGVVRETSFGTSGALDNGTSLWFSAIFDLEGANVANADINISLGTAAFVTAFGDRENLVSGEGIGIGHSRGTIEAVHWRDSGDGDAVAERNEIPSSTTLVGGTDPADPHRALIVGRIDWGADDSASEAITLWTPGFDLALGAPALATTSIAALDQSQFNQLAIQYKDSPLVDEIRFGTTSADVLPTAIPEPSSIILLALGSLAATARRRR